MSATTITKKKSTSVVSCDRQIRDNFPSWDFSRKMSKKARIFALQHDVIVKQSIRATREWPTQTRRKKKGRPFFLARSKGRPIFFFFSTYTTNRTGHCTSVDHCLGDLSRLWLTILIEVNQLCPGGNLDAFRCDREGYFAWWVTGYWHTCSPRCDRPDSAAFYLLLRASRNSYSQIVILGEQLRIRAAIKFLRQCARGGSAAISEVISRALQGMVWRQKLCVSFIELDC